MKNIGNDMVNETSIEGRTVYLYDICKTRYADSKTANELGVRTEKEELTASWVDT